MAHRFGAIPLEAQAHSELRSTGARPRRPLLTGVDALTPQEHRVADMAAGGATNREIAECLFVTLKTVEAHLGASYRKLDLKGREQLSAALGT